MQTPPTLDNPSAQASQSYASSEDRRNPNGKPHGNHTNASQNSRMAALAFGRSPGRSGLHSPVVEDQRPGTVESAMDEVDLRAAWQATAGAGADRVLLSFHLGSIHPRRSIPGSAASTACVPHESAAHR